MTIDDDNDSINNNDNHNYNNMIIDLNLYIKKIMK